MPELDPQAFHELFDAEPSDASTTETAAWIDVYERLIAMMEHQLDETRTFAKGVHQPMQRYLSRENMSILEEEIDAFQKRLAHWSDSGNRTHGSRSVPE